MVKNVGGGNRGKSFARKNVRGNAHNINIRYAIAEGEIYAVATKMLGNCQFNAMCEDGIERIGYIRGKFSGKNKSHNTVGAGTWVLLGLLDWDNTDAKQKKQKCDLLEVYSPANQEQLRDTVNRDWSVLITSTAEHKLLNGNAAKENKITTDEIEFTNDDYDEIEAMLREQKAVSKTSVVKQIIEEEIDIDDI